MKAGRSGFEVGTMVRVTSVTSTDPEDLAMVGVVGEATHAFPGLMVGDADQYLMGLHLDDENRRKAGLVAMPLGGGAANLLVGDGVEAVDPDDARG